MRHFAGLVFLPALLLVVNLWVLAVWCVELLSDKLEGDGNPDVPGLIFMIAITVGVIWIDARVGRRLVATARRRWSAWGEGRL